MTLLPGLEVVLVTATPRVVERPALVGLLIKPPAGQLLTAGPGLDLLLAYLGGLQDLLLVTAGVLTGLNTREPVLVTLAASVREVPALSGLVIVIPPREVSLTGSAVKRLLTHGQTPGLDTGLLTFTFLDEPNLHSAYSQEKIFK